jgi:fructose-1,6-bisphosphatase
LRSVQRRFQPVDVRLVADELHERTPVFVGDESYVDRLEAALD